MKKEQIVKHEPQAMTEVPKYLQRAAGVQAGGFEEVEQGDMTVPQMRLCQSLTPQRQQNESKYIEGLREGEYFNTVTSKNYGKLVQIVPLMFFKNRIRFKSKDEGGGILCRSEDMKKGTGDPGVECATCKYNEFGSAKDGKGKGKACTEFYNFPVIPIENGHFNPSEIAVRSFKSSGVPEAKSWLALMRLRGIDMYGGVYDLTSASKKFSEGTSYVEVVKNAGNVSEETYRVANQLHLMARNMFSVEMRQSGRTKIDEQAADDDFPEPGSAG